MRIALDAMGSDNHPIPDVEGAVLAARESGDTVLLVGDEPLIAREIQKHPTSGLNLEIVPAAEVIAMDDKPAAAAREKVQSSMHVGMNLVKDGAADAFVTMGNTGAAYAVAMLYTLGRIHGVKRPALSGIFPLHGRQVVFVDVGANADSKADWLVQFAIMGQIYATNALGLSNPRVGLLSNGEEEDKGSQIIRDAGELLQALPINFVGNVEPKEALNAVVDVVVCDGFTGNILAKTFEATASYLVGMIRDEIRKNVFTTLGGLLVRPAFGQVRANMDTGQVGGAPLLGMDGVVIIGHGRSNAFAIKNAIHQAHRAVEGRIIEAIRQGLEQVAKPEHGVAVEVGGIDKNGTVT